MSSQNPKREMIPPIAEVHNSSCISSSSRTTNLQNHQAHRQQTQQPQQLALARRNIQQWNNQNMLELQTHQKKTQQRLLNQLRSVLMQRRTRRNDDNDPNDGEDDVVEVETTTQPQTQSQTSTSTSSLSQNSLSSAQNNNNNSSSNTLSDVLKHQQVYRQIFEQSIQKNREEKRALMNRLQELQTEGEFLENEYRAVNDFFHHMALRSMNDSSR